MATKVCPKCQTEVNGRAALKQHMSDNHGGYTNEDIGPSDTGNMARSILGSNSLDELSGKIPSDDSGQSGESSSADQKQKTGKPKKNAAEIAEQERKTQAMKRVGSVICRKIAAMPYAVWSKLAANDSLRLTTDEQKELADAYLEIAQGYDADFSSPFFGVIAALAINAECITKRLDLNLSGFEETQG